MSQLPQNQAFVEVYKTYNDYFSWYAIGIWYGVVSRVTVHGLSSILLNYKRRRNFLQRIGSIPQPIPKLNFMLHKDDDSLLVDSRLWLAVGLLGALLSFILISYPG